MLGGSKKDGKKKADGVLKKSEETIKKNSKDARRKSVEVNKKTGEPYRKKSVEFRNKVDERRVDEFLVIRDDDDDTDQVVFEYYKSEKKRKKSDDSLEPSEKSSKSTFEEVLGKTEKTSKKKSVDSVEKPTKKPSKKKVTEDVIESDSENVDKKEIETVEHKKKSEESHKKSKKTDYTKYEEYEEKKISKSSKHKAEEVVLKSDKSSTKYSEELDKFSKSSLEDSESKSEKLSKSSSEDLSLEKTPEMKFKEILMEASADDISQSKFEESIAEPPMQKLDDSEKYFNMSLEDLIEKSIELIEKSEIIEGVKSDKSSKGKFEESIVKTETSNSVKTDKSYKNSDESIVKAEDVLKKSDESYKKTEKIYKTKLEESDKTNLKVTDKLIEKIDEITGKLIRIDNSDEEIVMTAIINEATIASKDKDQEENPGQSSGKKPDEDVEIIENNTVNKKKSEEKTEGQVDKSESTASKFGESLKKLKKSFSKKKGKEEPEIEETLGATDPTNSAKSSKKSLEVLKDEKFVDEEAKNKNGSVREEPKVQDQAAYTDAPSYYATMESWGYAVFKKAIVLGAVYLVGYMHWSVAWLIGPMVILVVRDEMQRRGEASRSIAIALASGNEKDAVRLKLRDLPAWVIYPDVERADWINLMLEQIWPNVNHYARKYIKDVIEPAVAQNIQGFRFDRIVLGTIPPKIGGVKVYDRNISRNEIIIDMDIYYSGNCDITFALRGVRGGMKDFQMNGVLRFVLKPLIPITPFFGGLQIFYLNNPNIDFNMVGVADILDMPGLRDMLRYMFVEQVAALMVLPNKLVISMSDSVPLQTLRIPEAEGVLRVHVIEAKHLINTDFGFLSKIKSDPYVIVNVGAQEMRTSVISNNLNPKWDQWCEAVVETIEQTLFLEVWDRDDAVGTKDDNLGRASMEISYVARRGHVDQWLTLEQVPHGILHVRLFWMALSYDPRDLNVALQEQNFLLTNGLNTSLLTIFVDCAKSLPRARVSTQPDPFVLMSVGNTTQKTLICARTVNPIWEEAFTFMVFNPLDDSLNIKILDQKTSNELGELSYSLSYLMRVPRMEVTNEEFQLQSSAPDSKIVLCLRLRIMKHQGPSADLMENSDESSIYSKGKDFISPGKTSQSDIMSIPQKPQAKEPEPEPKEPKKTLLPEDLTEKLSRMAPQGPTVTQTLPVHVKLVKSPACIPKGRPQSAPQCPPVVTACPVSDCPPSVLPRQTPLPCPTESQPCLPPCPQTSCPQAPYPYPCTPCPQTSYTQNPCPQLPPCPQPSCPPPTCPPPLCPPPICPPPICPPPVCLPPLCPQPYCPPPLCPQPVCPQPSCPQPQCPQPSCPQPACPQLPQCPPGMYPTPTMYTPMPFPQTSYGPPACPTCPRPVMQSRSSANSCLRAKTRQPPRPRGTSMVYDNDPMEAVSSTTSTHGDLGRARISVSYDPCSEILTVFVHNVVGLPLKDDGNCPDTYVKVYAIPGGRKKEAQYKTDIVKDDCNPVFEEKFEFTLAQCDLYTARVELMVFEKKLIGGNPLLGRICIDLKEYDICCRCQIICCDMCPIDTPKTEEKVPKKEEGVKEVKKKVEETIKREIEETVKRREEIIRIIEERQRRDIEEHRKLIVEEIRKREEDCKCEPSKKKSSKKDKKKRKSSSSSSCCSSCDSSDDNGHRSGKTGKSSGRSRNASSSCGRKRRGSRDSRTSCSRRTSRGNVQPVFCDKCSFQNACMPIYYDAQMCGPTVVHTVPSHGSAACCQAAKCASQLGCPAAECSGAPCAGAMGCRLPGCGTALASDESIIKKPDKCGTSKQVAKPVSKPSSVPKPVLRKPPLDLRKPPPVKKSLPNAEEETEDDEEPDNGPEAEDADAESSAAEEGPAATEAPDAEPDEEHD